MSRTLLALATSLAALLASAPATADDVLLTYTKTNDTGGRVAGLGVCLDGPGPGPTGAHDLVASSNPTLCGAPVVFLVPDGGCGTGLDYAAIEWSCPCVAPGESVTFSVLVPAGTQVLYPGWLRVGTCTWVTGKPEAHDIDGDQDGYPDTNETVDLAIRLTNRWTGGLTGVVAHLATNDPKIDCVVTPTVSVGSIPAGASADLPSPLRIHVSPSADRAGTVPPVSCTGGLCSNGAGVCSIAANCPRTVNDDYSATLVVTITADQLPDGQSLLPLVLDFDLDAATAATSSATYTEGFEAGFGSLTFMNLDVGKATNALSNGYRCQYNDPDFIGSSSYGDTECFLGFPAGQSPANAWHLHTSAAPDGGRAYQGNNSLHYGLHVPGDASLDTYQTSQLDALRSKTGINLAPRVCRDDPGAIRRPCTTAADCVGVGGGPCVSASPELSFKQQVSAADNRCTHPAFGETMDRAVVSVRIAAGTVWQKVYPYMNGYDSRASNLFTNCSFDPIDDGNDEDSYFDPNDPHRQYGPSSTCYPEFVFSYMGDTDEPFDASKVGHANDGPGLQGSVGIGTWVESKVDLSRYRGQSILLRWLFTSIKAGPFTTYEDLFSWNPEPCDDGWYVDDIRVTETLGTAASTVSPDTANNGALPGNMDGDARGDECDCAPADPTAFALPEVTGLVASNKITLSWTSAALTGGSGTVYDALRGALSGLPVGGGGPETCLVSGTVGSSVVDASIPGTGAGFWYVVRARNNCGAGSYGLRRNGAERTSTTCP